jgi:hypothetical protein
MGREDEMRHHMRMLSDRLSPLVLDALGRLGSEGAPLVAALVDAPDEELARLEDYYGQPREPGHHGEPDSCRVHGGWWKDCADQHGAVGNDGLTDAEREQLAREYRSGVASATAKARKSGDSL